VSGLGLYTILIPIAVFGLLTAPDLIVYRFGAGVFYANVERLTEEVLGLVDGDTTPRWLILDAAAIDDIDYTGDKTLDELADQLQQRNVVLAVCEVDDSVRTELDAFGITAKVGSEHIYDTAEDAINKLRNARG
jgi:SulP family sulfate permease